jgi:hypothetical protein
MVKLWGMSGVLVGLLRSELCFITLRPEEPFVQDNLGFGPPQRSYLERATPASIAVYQR